MTVQKRTENTTTPSTRRLRVSPVEAATLPARIDPAERAIPAQKYFIYSQSASDPIAVVLPIQQYRALLEEIEDLECTIAYDEGMAELAAGGRMVPFDEAMKQIEALRQGR